MTSKEKKMMNNFSPSSFVCNSFPMDETLDCGNDLFDYFFTDDSTWLDSSSEMSPPSSSQSPLPSIEISSPTSITVTPPPPLFDPCETNCDQIKQELELPKVMTNSSSSSKSRSLSPEEERQLKRQKRLIKNRESAQLSRLRKKIYIEELEKKVTHLATQNELLTQQVNSFSVEKKKLTEEVLYLQNVVKSSQPSGSTSSESSTTNNSLVPVKRNPANLKAAGVCLLMVLFSFGLIFNAAQQQNHNQDKSLTWNLNNRREEITEKSLFTNPLSTTVQIQPSIVEKKEIKKNPSSKRSREEAGLLIEDLSSVEVPETSSQKPQLPTTKLESVSKKRRMDQKPTVTSSTKREVLPVAPSIEKRASTTPSAPTPTSSSSVSSIPPSSDLSPPDMVALLVPSRLVNPSLFVTEVSSPPLQVLQQLLNLYVWPMSYSS